jgi:hypothetical protein
MRQSLWTAPSSAPGNENEVLSRSLVLPTRREGRSLRDAGLASGATEYSVGPRFKAPQALQAHIGECLVGLVIEGELELEAGGQQHRAPSGTLIYIPRGTLFRWRNTGERSLRWVCFFLSGVAEIETARVTDSLQRLECSSARSEGAWNLFNGLCARRPAARKAG